MIPVRLSRIQSLILLVLTLLVLCAGTLFFQTYIFLHTPSQTEGTDVTITIKPGQNFTQVAALLEARGVIRDQRTFKVLGRFNKQVGSIQAGEFRLNTSWLPRRVLQELTHGQSILHSLTIPEGLTWWQIADHIEQAGLGSAQRFRAVIHDPAFLKKWNIPASSAEGYLFPDTYLFPKPRTGMTGTGMTGTDTAGTDTAETGKSGTDTTRTCADTMVRTFRKITADLLPETTSPADIRRILTLASLVEKETARPEERARIAGVYANRLRRSMRLQCDPTIIYGIGPDFNGNLTRKDIRNTTNIYNTYAHAGLPPGPICSPGRAAIHAALHPEKHTFLYFVARGDGSHVFSKTLREHNRAVRRYQLHGQ